MSLTVHGTHGKLCRHTSMWVKPNYSNSRQVLIHVHTHAHRLGCVTSKSDTYHDYCPFCLQSGVINQWVQGRAQACGTSDAKKVCQHYWLCASGLLVKCFKFECSRIKQQQCMYVGVCIWDSVHACWYSTVHREHDGNFFCRLSLFAVIAPLSVNIFDYLLAFNR